MEPMAVRICKGFNSGVKCLPVPLAEVQSVNVEPKK